MQIGSVNLQAKFSHDGGSGVGLRLQCFLLVRDDAGRVATVRLRDVPDGWCLPGELLRVNEDPDEAARRVAASWFASPVTEPRLVSVESYPATGGEDTKWYLIFLYEARPQGELAIPSDSVEVRFTEPGKAAGPWAMAHGDVWERVR